MDAKKKMLPGLLGIIIIALALYFGMNALEPMLLQNPKLFGYGEWISKWPQDLLYKGFWIVGDFSEAAALKSLLGGVGIVAGAITAHLLCRKKPELKIYPISQGSGNLPWILLSAGLGLIISVCTYGSFLKEGMFWIPTFLPGCTLPAAMVLLYGGGWKVSLTAGVLSGLIQFPFAYGAFLLSMKAGLPPLCLIMLLAICLAGLIIIEVFRLLPWNRQLIKGQVKPQISPYENKVMVPPEPKFSWLLRRSVTDLTELSFFGSEVVAIFLLAGSFLSWFLNPAHICSGVPGLFPAILTAQLITGALCAFFFFEKWKTFGFCPTFSAVVGASVCIMQFGPQLPVVLLASVLNLIITANLANLGFAWGMSHVKRYPVLCVVVVPIGIGIGVVSLIMRLVFMSGMIG